MTTFLIPVFLILIVALFFAMKRMYRMRIRDLTDYLEKINMDKAAVLPLHPEDDFSMLEDELYKTITKLRQTREEAIREHNSLAASLADISHQIKTPVASISLMTQLMEKEENKSYTERIRNQTTHLERLVGSLLTLARIDAGVLSLEKNSVNVYTMLQLTVEELEPIITAKALQVSLPNHEELCYEGDMDWSIEAFSNILKNCIEHTPEGGNIVFHYFQNPLYLQIQLEDTGEGFTEKELPHIFERFYQGDKEKSGTGIGLSLAKALIEQQNGVISANNRSGGGACFTIRFYCH